MNNHYFDTNGVYTHSAPANPGSLPPSNALRLEPPRKEGWWPVRDASGAGWELVEDHRGKTGWHGGEPVVIAQPGPLPEGWSDNPPQPADTRDHAGRRRDDFALEADPVGNLALARHLEAEAWRLAGNQAKAKEALAKYRYELRRLLEKKEEIRSRHPVPDPENGTSGTEPEPVAEPDMDKPLYFLTRSGVYHTAGCSYTRASGEWLHLSDVLVRRPTARACGKCSPATEG